MIINSIQAGKIVTHPGDGSHKTLSREFTTGFYKTRISGLVKITQAGIVGDQQHDLKNHGGPDKAILVYSQDHFPYWKETLNLDVQAGGFGENFTVMNFDETMVCLGDTWRIGNVMTQVTQPRQPCWKLARRWNRLELPKKVIKTGKSGWYLRVTKAGEVNAPHSITLIDRPHEKWTISRLNQLYYAKEKNYAELEELIEINSLADAWRDDLKKRLISASN